jgi:outer membrane protein assembly factor BamB
VTERLVLVGSDYISQGYLYALERSSGAVRWKHPFPGGVGVQTFQKGDMAFTVSAAGEVVAVEIESGRIVWRSPPSEETGDRSLDPVLGGDRLFVPWREGTVDAFDLATGRRIWRAYLGQRLNTSLAAVGSALVVGSFDGELHRLRQEDGSILGHFELKGVPYGDLVEAGGCLLALSSEDPSFDGGPATLACLDPSLTKALWTFRSAGELSTFRPLLHEGRAVVGGRGSLIGLDLSSGAEAWSCPLKGVARGLGYSGATLYVGTLGGTVYALDPARCSTPASSR